MNHKWESLLFLVAKLFVAAVLGTIVLMGLADNPWDGDEFIKGPLTGLISYGGGDIKRIFDSLKEMGS